MICSGNRVSHGNISKGLWFRTMTSKKNPFFMVNISDATRDAFAIVREKYRKRLFSLEYTGSDIVRSFVNTS